MVIGSVFFVCRWLFVQLRREGQKFFFFFFFFCSCLCDNNPAAAAAGFGSCPISGLNLGALVNA